MIDESDAGRLLIIRHHVENLDQKIPVRFRIAAKIVVIQVGKQKINASHVQVTSKVFVDFPGIEIFPDHGQDHGRLMQVFLTQRQTTNGLPVGRSATMVETVGVVVHLRPVKADTHLHAMSVENLYPLKIDQHAVCLDCQRPLYMTKAIK